MSDGEAQQVCYVVWNISEPEFFKKISANLKTFQLFDVTFWFFA